MASSCAEEYRNNATLKCRVHVPAHPASCSPFFLIFGAVHRRREEGGQSFSVPGGVAPRQPREKDENNRPGAPRYAAGLPRALPPCFRCRVVPPPLFRCRNVAGCRSSSPQLGQAPSLRVRRALVASSVAPRFRRVDMKRLRPSPRCNWHVFTTRRSGRAFPARGACFRCSTIAKRLAPRFHNAELLRLAVAKRFVSARRGCTTADLHASSLHSPSLHNLRAPGCGDTPHQTKTYDHGKGTLFALRFVITPYPGTFASTKQCASNLYLSAPSRARLRTPMRAVLKRRALNVPHASMFHRSRAS